MKNKGVALVEIVVSMLILAVSALAVTATVSMVNNTRMHRSAGGSSLDLQALSYARETLDVLKNAVSTNGTRFAAFSTGSHNSTTDPTLLSLPVGSDLLKSGRNGKRTYAVSNVNGTDLKKVTVSVTWDD